ncbi:MAG TPA: CPBP family glutamic-type intramembrane protease [Nitrososphaerales archaeon]|nr:CPBP family glutamic-type intramembrane protease [Nitrososphaerales archaeon]
MISFWLIWPLSLVGAVAIQPYQVQVTRRQRAGLRSRSSSDRFYALVGLSQTAVLLTVADLVGVEASSKVGLGWVASGLSSAWLPFACLGSIALGVVLGLSLPALDDRIFRDLSRTVSAAPAPSRLQALGASLYGGISEEAISRLFVMSVLVYAVTLLSSGGPWPFIFGVIGSSLLFGAGHLPLALRLLGGSARVYERTLLLNGIAGVVFGVVFWQLGLGFAMVSHFTADVLLHVRHA